MYVFYLDKKHLFQPILILNFEHFISMITVYQNIQRRYQSVFRLHVQYTQKHRYVFINGNFIVQTHNHSLCVYAENSCALYTVTNIHNDQRFRENSLDKTKENYGTGVKLKYDVIIYSNISIYKKNCKSLYNINGNISVIERFYGN